MLFRSGIDVEPVTRDIVSLLPEFATTEEAELLRPLSDEDASAATRLWCAKEAMAKARGTGLQGRPKEFGVLEIEANGDFLLCHRVDGERRVVHTELVGPFVLAYTSVSDRIFGDNVEPGASATGAEIWAPTLPAQRIKRAS